MTGWLAVFVCPELSTPKPLDQSKIVTVRTFHKLSRDKNGQKDYQKVPKKSRTSFRLPTTSPRVMSLFHLLFFSSQFTYYEASCLRFLVTYFEDRQSFTNKDFIIAVLSKCTLDAIFAPFYQENAFNDFLETALL